MRDSATQIVCRQLSIMSAFLPKAQACDDPHNLGKIPYVLAGRRKFCGCAWLARRWVDNVGCRSLLPSSGTFPNRSYT
jgi:hypothetical protein